MPEAGALSPWRLKMGENVGEMNFCRFKDGLRTDEPSPGPARRKEEGLCEALGLRRVNVKQCRPPEKQA